MPTVLILVRLRFVIYPKDHDPPHVHVIGPDAEVRFDLRSVTSRLFETTEMFCWRHGMSFKNKNIRYGKVELTESEFHAKNIKQRITMFVDQDVLLEYKRLARKSGDKYQSLINRTLREALGHKDLERRVTALERRLIQKK